MKSILDDSKIRDQLDTRRVYESITKISQQFASSWHDAQFINLNFEPEKIKNIVYVGMGGSALPGLIVKSLAPLLLKVTFEIVSNYRLPQYTGEDTLVILTSYSGNTEEVLSCGQDALKRKCKTIAITTDGRLKELALTEHWPLIVLEEKLNPTHDSRFGLGLMLGAAMGLMTRLNQESFRFIDPKEIVRTLEKTIDSLSSSRPTTDNPAKIFAQKNKGNSLIIFSANHLTGVGKISVNYLNETSKTFSAHYSIPNLNHHLLDGLLFPLSLKENTHFILLNSSLYPDIIQKRFQITKDILLKQKYQLTVIKPESKDIVLEVFESLVFLVMISYYLSIVNKQDPGTNPWVDFFKKQLI